MSAAHHRRHHGRILSVDSLEAFDALVARGARSMSGWRVQDVDLTERAAELRSLDAHGSVFLGCELLPDSATSLRARGAVVYDDVPDMPFRSFRNRLYTADELYGDAEAEFLPEGAEGPARPAEYRRTLDAHVFAWTRSREVDDARTLASALHDHAIDLALREWVRGRHVVGVMGGHRMLRGTPEYASVAELGRRLTLEGYTVATGGGPGAMEAANLGAYLSSRDEGALASALETLARVPGYTPDFEPWVDAAFEVRERFAGGADSLGVPTWFYGHEPAQVFATAIAKYFANSVREDVLLNIANAGLVVMPGEGGTVQEIFQDGCENSYADAAGVAPMVLVGRDYWTREYPAWPLLQALMRGRPAERHIHLVDDTDEVLNALATSWTELEGHRA